LLQQGVRCEPDFGAIPPARFLAHPGLLPTRSSFSRVHRLPRFRQRQTKLLRQGRVSSTETKRDSNAVRSSAAAARASFVLQGTGRRRLTGIVRQRGHLPTADSDG
jgi:hypothetical protein